MIFIVLVCIASATLFAWLATQRGRFAIGDFRMPRPAIGPSRTPAPATAPKGPSGPAAPSVPAGPQGPSADRSPASRGDDVEQRVRDRLYGERNGALRRAPLAND